MVDAPILANVVGDDGADGRRARTESVDSLLIEGLSEDEDDAFAAALES